MHFGNEKTVKLALCGAAWFMNTVCTGASSREIILNASSVEYRTDGSISEAELRRLLPELRRERIRVNHLSKTIQLINEQNSMKLTVQFMPDSKKDTYKVVVVAEDKKNSKLAVSLKNTGNEYTGDFRSGISYTNNDVTRNADTVNILYNTSPDHKEDVHQAAICYKAVFPHSGDSAYISYAYSDVDVGNVASIYGLNLYSKGKSQSAGVHYQHNFKYTSTVKEILDVGIDYRKMKGHHELKYGGTVWAYGGYDVEEKFLSATYSYSRQRKRDAFSYSIGYIQNFDGDGESYEKYRHNADRQFSIWTLSGGYQYRLPSNWIFSLGVNAQYTKNNLMSSDQLSAGGMYSVRGFEESAVNGDRGFRGNLAIYTPEIGKSQRFVLFYDYAALRNNSYNIGESRKNLASVGLGYRMFNYKGFSVSIDYAVPIVKFGVSNKTHRPWHLSISKEF